MKYLRLHTVLWIILVFIYTLIEVAYFVFLESLYFIWCFKLFQYESFFRNDSILRGSRYTDRNPIDTFKRHYCWFD